MMLELSETGTEFGCFHVNTISRFLLPSRGIDPIQSGKPEELLARQVLAWLGIYFRMS